MSDAERPYMGDTHALLAQLRDGDAEAVERAYAHTFAGPIGRLVLAHIAAEAGVGRPFGGKLTATEMAYHQGGHDVALEILERAGFDPSSAALMVMTGHLEGHEHERSSFPAGGPVADADDAPDLTD